MSTLLESLHHLQQLDDKLSGMEQRQKAIPEQLSSREKEIEEDNHKNESYKQKLKEVSQKQKNLENELKDNTEQIKKKQSRQFDVKTNAEYKALLKEIEFIKQSNSAKEDEILMLFDEIDALNKSIREKQKEIKEKEKQYQAEKQQLEQDLVELNHEHKALKRERKRLAQEIDESSLKKYEKIRTQRSGMAVVTPQGESCPGCHMFIPPQTINEVLQTGEIRYCSYCNRIIYCEQELNTA